MIYELRIKNLILTAFLIFLFYFCFAARAESIIPQPVKDITSSAKQIESDLLNPRPIFDKIAGWFYEITGIRLSDVLKAIGNFFALLFSTLADLIRWGVSLI